MVYVLRGSSVFSSCRQAAADMPFRFVLFQHLSNLLKQRRVDPTEAFCKVLVYGRFADAELSCGSAYRRIVFNHIKPQFLSAIFDLISQIPSLPRYSCIMYMTLLRLLCNAFWSDAGYSKKYALTDTPYGYILNTPLGGIY